MNNAPLLSVIIPVYDSRPYLSDCLKSLKRQTLRDWEAILVDDGSTDGSDEVLKAYAEADGRFRYAHQSNSGLSVARNTGLALAKGIYVAFLDSDDWFVSDGWQNACWMTLGKDDFIHYEPFIRLFEY